MFCYFSKEFSAISKAREDDMQKKKNLDYYYSLVQNYCLAQIDDNLTSMLTTFYSNRDIKKVLDEQVDRLGKRDYHLLVAGNWP